jgi:alanine racemase
MTFSLYVDEDRWRTHLSSVVDATPGIVPVIKGNGYGLGNARLAAEAARLGVPAVAVGTSDELPEVREHFDGDVLVMSPSYPRCEPDDTGRVLRTVAHLETLRAGGGARVVVEGMTTMRRHGLAADAVPYGWKVSRSTCRWTGTAATTPRPRWRGGSSASPRRACRPTSPGCLT